MMIRCLVFIMDSCPFCVPNLLGRVLLDSNYWVAIYDGYPVTFGHVLLVPLRHIPTVFSLDFEEIIDLIVFIPEVREHIERKHVGITGWNIGVNCGMSAGQTVSHAHIHMIPRRDGDTSDPRGGVRGVIPGRRGYSEDKSLLQS